MLVMIPPSGHVRVAEESSSAEAQMLVVVTSGLDPPEPGSNPIAPPVLFLFSPPLPSSPSSMLVPPVPSAPFPSSRSGSVPAASEQPAWAKEPRRRQERDEKDQNGSRAARVMQSSCGGSSQPVKNGYLTRNLAL